MPYVAPVYGGVNARVLLLLRDPGPKTNDEAVLGGSGFISFENDDPTAERLGICLDQSGLRPEDCTAWNAYPWYINRDPDLDQLGAGVEALIQLLALMPRLEVVMLLGGAARKCWRKLEQRDPALAKRYTTIATRHTSQQAFIGTTEQKEAWKTEQVDAFGKAKAMVRRKASSEQEPEGQPLDDIQTYYEGFAEESRLGFGPARLEFARTKEILTQRLPAAPATVVDVGGAAGAYSLWLAEQGYELHLVDVSTRLVEEARKRNVGAAKPIAALTVADARCLPQPDASAAAALVLGPLYHLTARSDRLQVLGEVLRVLAGEGIAFFAAISRYASALDGMARRLSLDPRFVAIRNRDLVDGQHRNETNHPDYFTTAYFHRPEELRAEVEEAGFVDVELLGVEGPAWLMADFDDRWDDPELRKDMLDVARALEAEPSTVGISAHLLAIGRKP